MVPCVAALVVRRCRDEPVLVTRLPVGLSFQVPTVAGSAMLDIDRRAAGDDARVAWGSRSLERISTKEEIGTEYPVAAAARRP